MIKNINRFSKLFGIKNKIVLHDEFDYYIDLLSKTNKYSNIKEIIKLYNECELKYDDFSKFSKQKSDEIIKYLKESNSYKNLIDFSDYNLRTNYSPSELMVGVRYLSIDLKKANWSVFKNMDKDSELPNSYEELLDKFNCPKVLSLSKQYRQIIFGNLNPKKQQKIQRSIMYSIIQYLAHIGNCSFNIMSITNDEIIISDYDYTELKSSFDKIGKKYNLHINEFELNEVDDIKIRKFYKLNTYNLLYKELYKVDGNMYFIYLKKYILDEKIEIRDLYFRNNGKLALWADDLEMIKNLLNG